VQAKSSANDAILHTMNQENSDAAGAPFLGSPFDDPLKTWPNSDLLIAQEDREFFARHYPDFAPIFDWPELRSLFVSYDSSSARARARSRRSGVIAVFLGFLSLSMGATVPLVEELAEGNATHDLRTRAVLGGIAAALAIVSIVIGYTQILRGKAKAQWLTNRFWGERIRQFHFQLIISHLPEVVAAVKSHEKMQAWLAFRSLELDNFKQEYLRGVGDKVHHLDEDEAEDRPWISEVWSHACDVPPSSPELDTLLKLLEQQRFGIQHRYTERRLMIGWHSPDTRSQWVSKLSDALTAVLLLATVTVGIGSIDAFFENTNPSYRIIVAFIAALSSSSVVAMRALKEGLLFGADAERYKWYSAAVRTLYHRFEHADRQQKVQLLRELEHVAYQEMRRFILAVKQARFVM
jgi:hypothetical protein